ncbi:tetratricopeptide repeat-containing sensor histidine kinase [Taibaiella helva]|uniref:tetratricopeptide repeat-containing sensor histidine kinase n=1 Tax=Taibaiella helva TaxID=2301235 RepID=UPI000E574044|nr:sensor histidine kinase [Taibaiella helva]
MFRILILSALLLLSVPLVKAQDGFLSDYAKEQLSGIPPEQQDSFYLVQGRYYYAFYTRESYRRAMECYLEALRLAIQYKHKAIMYQCYFGIGSVYDANNNLPQAVRYYKMHYDGVLQARPFNATNVLRATYNIAASYAKAGDTANASHYTLKMGQMLDWLTDSTTKHRYSLLIAHLFSITGQQDDFLKYFAQIQDRNDFSDGELAYGRLFAEEKSRYALLKGQKDQVIPPLLNELAHTKDSIPLLNLLHKSYARLGQYKEAYEVEQLLVDADMRSMDRATYGDINYRLLEADNLLKQRENAELQLNGQELQWQSSLLYALAALLTTGLVITLILYRRFRNRNRITTEENKEIREHDESNSLMLKEIHHRVKNNLQIISSMVEMQLNKPGNDLYFSMREIQTKMRTLAIAHQMMYEGEEMKEVDMQAYFENMVVMTLELLASSSNPVEQRIQMHDNKLGLEKLIILALAVNEMLINSLKHVLPYVGGCYIAMECRLIDGEYHFTYSDNGPEAAAEGNVATITGTGIRLIHKLAKQMDAKILVEKEQSGKIQYLMIFSKTNKRQ